MFISSPNNVFIFIFRYSALNRNSEFSFGLRENVEQENVTLRDCYSFEPKTVSKRKIRKLAEGSTLIHLEDEQQKRTSQEHLIKLNRTLSDLSVLAFLHVPFDTMRDQGRGIVHHNPVFKYSKNEHVM